MSTSTKIIFVLSIIQLLTISSCLYKTFSNKQNYLMTQNEISQLKKIHDEEILKIKEAYELESKKNQQTLKELENKRVEIQKKYDDLRNILNVNNKKKVDHYINDVNLDQLAAKLLLEIENYEKSNY